MSFAGSIRVNAVPVSFVARAAASFFATKPGASTAAIGGKTATAASLASAATGSRSSVGGGSSSSSGSARQLGSKPASAAAATSASSTPAFTSTDGKGGPAGEGMASPFFTDISDAIADNTPELRYGVCATDVDKDGQIEFFVCGFGFRNRVLKWDKGNQRLMDVGGTTSTQLADSDRMAIGVAAGDLDGDGHEEIYVLNTDTYGGRKRVGDRLFDLKDGRWEDLFSQPQNMDDANLFAGRSVCVVDRFGSGRYGFFAANYGGAMKLFELQDGQGNFLADVAKEAGLVMYPTGGRSLMSLPLVSHAHMDIFAGNEGGPNFLFVNKGDGSGKFVESAAAYGLMDTDENCRGVAAVDVDGTGELGICTGNWEGPHRLFHRAGPGPKGGAKALGFADVPADVGGFADVAPEDMARPSRIRTVIAADFDNDGYEELFFNNIGQPNRLFRQDGPGHWVRADIGDAALPNGLGTGASVADIDSDGLLELLVAHGESGMQPMALFRCTAQNARTNAWLRVQPLTRQGAPARGATVQVQDSAGRWQKRAIDAGSGYLCCMEPVAHFGFGQQPQDATVTVRVTWPDGTTKDLKTVPLRQVLSVPHP